MGYFDEAKAEILRSKRIDAAWMVNLDFATDPVYLHSGFGKMFSGGQWWTGSRGLGAIQGLQAAINGQAPQVTLTLSGFLKQKPEIPDTPQSDYVRRSANISFQFLTPFSMQPLDDPYAIWKGKMWNRQVTYAWDDGRKGWVLTVAILCESLFYKRGRPLQVYYSDRHQQLLFPGDRGLERMGPLQNLTVRWPDF